MESLEERSVIAQESVADDLTLVRNFAPAAVRGMPSVAQLVVVKSELYGL